jgi:DnaJ-class molecular chaperone
MPHIFKLKKCPNCLGRGICTDGTTCPTCKGEGEIASSLNVIVPDEPCWSTN